MPLNLWAFPLFLAVKEEFFPPALIQLNLVTALNRFCEQCSLEGLNYDVSKFLTAQQYITNIIFPWLDRFFFLHGKRLFIDLISEGTKLRPRPLNTRQWEAITVSLVYPLAVPSTTPTHAHFILFPVSLASRDKDGDLSNPRIDIYNPTAKQGTVSSLLTECFWTVVSFKSNVICSAYFPKTPLYFFLSPLTRTRL